MADQDNSKNIQLLKKTSISVYVDDALPDILVVTYEYGVKIFKGVLLDSTKRNLPCGVQSLNPALKAPARPDDDPLYAVNQRFAYSDPSNSKKKNVQIPTKYKNSKMTVRLRPRQVLCSKCKGICNENSENVTRKRKAETAAPVVAPAPPTKRGLHAPVTRSVTVHSTDLTKKKLGQASLVPRLTRLTPQEEMNAMAGRMPVSQAPDEKCKLASPDKENTRSQSEDSSSSEPSSILSCNISGKSVRRVLRKKRSVGSMEDLWDESAFEENAANKNNNLNAQTNANEDPMANPNIPTNTRTIKISYGPQGEGTVLKIPAQIDNLTSGENACVEEAPSDEAAKTTDNKAARKALKKAKKEARRKVFLTGGNLGGSSPWYAIASSPRYTVGSASPRHGLGNNSPRYMYDLSMPRRRKHKMKHKKKHKEEKDRKHKEEEVSSTQEDPKEQSITQKLSINLKRLNNTYASCPSAPDKPEENSSSSDEQGGPDFLPPSPPLMLRMNTQPLTSAPLADGGRLLVGDVVWGKIQGVTWWPGKVLTISNAGRQGPQAHISWYGSSASSLLKCTQLSPYLDNFKELFDKKRRGSYKEAIKQATLEAKENAEQRKRLPLGHSPPQMIIPQVVPPALASPREIDVVS